MRQYDREFITNVISDLIPGVTVSSRIVPTREIIDSLAVKPGARRSGYFRRGNEVLIWGHIDSGNSFLFSVQREQPALSSRERKFIYFIPDVLEHLLPKGGLAEDQQFQRLASKTIIGTAVVAKFLQNKRGSGFWPPSFLLSILQTLVSQNYEGASATTGFVCVAKVSELASHRFTENYEFKMFGEPTIMHETFFDEPISYRYVDGRNAFYIIDRQSFVRGIVRIRHPLNWSLVDRIHGRHLTQLVSGLQGKAWAAMIGNKRDIQIVSKLGPEIRWNRNRWQYLHLECIKSYIAGFVASEKVADLLLRLAFSLSVMRTGSLVLIPADARRPKFVGGIDPTRVESKIEQTIVGMNIRDFVDGAGMFGVFGSDGLVIVRRDGTIEAAGKIVALPVQAQRIAGGGRTQAARRCSRFGLTIKVSEDGPISLFHNDKLIIRTNG